MTGRPGPPAGAGALRARLALWSAALVLVLAACAAPAPAAVVPGPPGTQDLGATPPEQLLDGGELRLPLARLPVNYNHLHVDGGTTDTRQVAWAMMPRAFELAADGRPVVATDYVTTAERVDATTLRYVVAPEARWSNGRPVDWTDFAAQAAVMRADDPRFAVFTFPSYQRIREVVAGADDREVLVRLDRPLAEWADLFSPLYPRETTEDPAAFATAWVGAAPVTAGPFRMAEVDPLGAYVVLERDPAWWGPPPRLDRIVFRAGSESVPDAMINGEIDAMPVGTPQTLARMNGATGIAVRTAPTRDWAHLTFNGAAGRVLAEREVRRAVAAAIDRSEVSRAVVGALAPVTLTGNHIHPVGAPGYRDNAAVLPFDPAGAERALDAAGWVRTGDGVRTRDGAELRLDMPAPPGSAVATVVRDQLARIGVAVDVRDVAPAEFGPRVLAAGAFDLVASQWSVPSTPASFAALAHADPVAQGRLGNNLGSVTTPAVRDAFDRALAELDDEARTELLAEADRLIWAEAHSLPLYAVPGVWAVREDLANWGARGLAEWDYVSAGYLPR